MSLSAGNATTGPALLEEYASSRMRRAQMCRWARQILTCAEDIDDCVQVALVKASQTIHRYDPAKGEFAPWLFTYVKRACLNHVRRRGPKEVMVGLVVLEDRQDASDGAGDIASLVCDRDEQEELLARAQQALCLLPPDLQQALWQASSGDASMEEAADILGGCTRNAAAVRLFRVRRTVRAVIAGRDTPAMAAAQD